MEQVPDDVRGITGVCESRLSQGAFLRTEVQGAEGGQDAGGLLHQTVGLPCPVPRYRNQLQSSREGIAHPFFGEEGDGVALQVGETYHRPCEVEPGDCGTFKGDVCQVGTTEGIIPYHTKRPQIRSPVNERYPYGNFIADHIIVERPVGLFKNENRPKGIKI